MRFSAPPLPGPSPDPLVFLFADRFRFQPSHPVAVAFGACQRSCLALLSTVEATAVPHPRSSRHSARKDQGAASPQQGLADA
eukprot:3273045-Rhodomonas_salina.1